MQLIEQGFEFVFRNVIASRCRNLARRSSLYQRIDGKRALAVQLVKQCFEFIIGDFVIGAWRGLCFRRRCADAAWGELTLAMQLVEQRLELSVGNFVAGCSRCLRLGFCLLLDRVQLIKQLLKFGVGNVRVGRGLRSLFKRRWRGCLIGACRLCQTRQGGQQLSGRWRDIGAFTHLAKHAVDRVQRFQDHVHQFCIDASLTLAQDVEHVLGDVAALHQLMELEEAGAPFYSMKTAKNCIEQVRIIRAAFQLDQLFGQLLKNLAGLYQEVLEDFFIGAEAH